MSALREALIEVVRGLSDEDLRRLTIAALADAGKRGCSTPPPKPGSLAARVLQSLRDDGPQTGVQLSSRFDHPQSAISVALSRLGDRIVRRPTHGGFVVNSIRDASASARTEQDEEPQRVVPFRPREKATVLGNSASAVARRMRVLEIVDERGGVAHCREIAKATGVALRVTLADAVAIAKSGRALLVGRGSDARLAKDATAVRRLPMLVAGHGERFDCARADECLDRFVAACGKKSDAPAHCQSDCAAFERPGRRAS